MNGIRSAHDRGGKRGDAQHFTPAALKILDTASRLFYDMGIHAVGVEAIAHEAGVTKKTLYDRFGSKSGLVLAYLRARDGLWRSALEKHVEAHGGAPEEKLLATFGALREWLRERNPRGCAFVNAHVELPAGHPGQDVAREQKAWLLTYMKALAADAGAQDPEGLAAQLLLLHEGACIANSMQSVEQAADRAQQTAEVLIGQALAR